METRSFQYTDAKSNKFWTITLEASSHTVSYGRIGASGKIETKTFSTSYLAKQSYEKLIQQKLSKGYIEVHQDTQSVVENTVEKISEQQDKQAIRAEVKSTDKLEITRVLNLNPEDWLWASWRPKNPLPRPEPKPFNQAYLFQHLADITKKYRYVEWEKAEISVSLCPEEAYFWLATITHRGAYHRGINYTSSKGLSTDLEKVSFNEQVLLDKDVIPALIKCNAFVNEITPKAVLPLNSLFELVKIFVQLEKIVTSNEEEALRYAQLFFENVGEYKWNLENAREELVRKLKLSALNIQRQLLTGFQKYLWKYLTDAELEQMRSSLRPFLDIQPSFSQTISSLIHLANLLGMHHEIQILVTSWSNDALTKNQKYYYYGLERGHGDLVFGLGDPEIISEQMHRLMLLPAAPEIICISLATTNFKALDLICLGIVKCEKYRVTQLIETLISVAKAPEMAPYILELVLESQAPAQARRWLEDNPAYAIVGLIPIAAGADFTPAIAKKTQLIEAATQFLRTMVKKGYESIIKVALEQETDVIANKIKAEVLEHKEITSVPFDENTTPKWLTIRTTDFRNFNTKNLFQWVKPTDLPPLLIGDNCLNNEQVATCLFALQQSTLDSPHPLVKNLKNHCNPQSLDNFIWSLFQRWLTEGAPSKDKWAMTALGLLGSDNIALKLVPLIRTWPGESQHSRAVFGLECLRAIGTDTALMQIHGISQKVKYQGLKKKASECLQAIAKQRKLTPEELEDRIIPDFGLDARGKRVFDFGRRQFHFVLSADLKPLVRDEKGKLSGSLPKPSVKDNAELANQAITDWKLLKKQIDQTIRIQSVRLEKAMITTRHWAWQEFETLLVHHPLMTHLVQRLVWGSYDANNQLIATFRVAEDQTYADAADEEYIPSGIASVDVIHPINLTTEQRAVWGQALSDYEIIPPFPQINRDIYILRPEEMEAKEITRFKEIPVPTATLVWTLESLEWKRGRTDQGEIQTHYKYFPIHNVTAVVGDYENAFFGGDMYGDEVIDACCFVSGNYVSSIDGMWSIPKERILRLSEVDTIVFSEVLRDLHIVTAKRSK